LVPFGELLARDRGAPAAAPRERARHGDALFGAGRRGQDPAARPVSEPAGARARRPGLVRARSAEPSGFEQRGEACARLALLVLTAAVVHRAQAAGDRRGGRRLLVELAGLHAGGAALLDAGTVER